MKRIAMGLAGLGTFAAQYLGAVRRFGNVDMIAIAGSTAEAATRFAGPDRNRLPAVDDRLFRRTEGL